MDNLIVFLARAIPLKVNNEYPWRILHTSRLKRIYLAFAPITVVLIVSRQPISPDKLIQAVLEISLAHAGDRQTQRALLAVGVRLVATTLAQYLRPALETKDLIDWRRGLVRYHVSLERVWVVER